MTDNEIEAVITFMGRDRPNELLGVERSKRQLERLFRDYDQYGDSALWTALHVSWTTPEMQEPTEESVGMDAWLRGERWPLLNAWVEG